MTSASETIRSSDEEEGSTVEEEEEGDARGGEEGLHGCWHRIGDLNCKHKAWVNGGGSQHTAYL